MPKLPWMQFYFADWLADTRLSNCTPATRGVWMDLLCAMHGDGRSGQLCGTTDQLARLARCSTADLTHALTDLRTTGAADVTERNGIVTLVNRRMKREAHERNTANDRQMRCRERKRGVVSRDCHAIVTVERTEVINQRPPSPRKRGSGGGESVEDEILAKLESSK